MKSDGGFADGDRARLMIRIMGCRATGVWLLKDAFRQWVKY